MTSAAPELDPLVSPVVVGDSGIKPISEPSTATPVIDKQPAEAAPHPSTSPNDIENKPLPSPPGNASATAEFTDADLPDTEDMIQHVGDISKGHEDGIEAVGWKYDQEKVPAPLIKKLENEQLWQLIRRFNMVSYYQYPLLDL